MDRPIPYLFNGQADGAIPVNLRGLHYGDGLFETIRWQGGAVFFQQHIDRLSSGCHRLRIPPPDPQLLLQECRQLATGRERAVIKIIISRGASKRGYVFDPQQSPDRLLICYDFPDYPSHLWQNGIKTRLCETRLASMALLAGIKHLNRLEQVMARSEWQDADIYEGFLMNDKDLLVEGCQSNVFLVKDGIVYTPNLEQCGVAGVIRQKVIEIAAEKQIALKVVDLTLDRLLEADEVFVTNSVIGVWPVAQIAQHKIAVGPLTRCFQAAINKLMEDQ